MKRPLSSMLSSRPEHYKYQVGRTQIESTMLACSPAITKLSNSSYGMFAPMPLPIKISRGRCLLSVSRGFCPNSIITYYHSYSFPSPSSYYTVPPSPSNFLTPQAGGTPAPNPCSYCCCTQCCGCGVQLVARNSGPLYHPVTPYVHPALTSISIVNRYSNRQLLLNQLPAEDQLAQAPQNGVLIFQNGLLNRPAGGYLYHGHSHEEQTANTGLVLLQDEKRCQDLQLVVVGPQDNSQQSPLDVDESVDMRGSDELLSQTGGAVSNGGAMSPQPNHTDNNNDAKKAKLDKSNGGTKPSKVIHIRNIPNEVTEAEIIHLGIPFGRVTNVLVLKGKNQAFLEMADEVAASTMVTYFTSCMAQLRGHAVYVQFSNHKELKTDQTHSNANASAQAALQAAQALSAGQTDTQGGPNTVLRVIIEHMMYPITLEVLYQIFSRFGKVLKIVTFTKNNSFQVLIQYPDVVTAQAAKLSLDGQNIYNSCCTLRIEYSKLSSLNVKYNNDKSRDYTNPSLPNGETGLDGVSLSEQLLPQLLLGGGSPALQAARRSLTQSDHARLAGAQGVLASPFTTLHGLGSPLAAPYAGSPVGGGISLAGFTQLGAGGNAALAAAGGMRIPGAMATTCVLLIGNLNEEVISPDALFTLFGVYGDVQRVKILYKKKDSALIQMAEPHQAQLAMTHLDKLKLFGKQMRVMASKHQTVQLPKEGQPDAGLTKDYTSSNLHRFKKPGSKNYQNIYPPSATLHLSNIPSTVTEEDMKEAFAKNCFTVKAFKFFPKDKRMALIQLASMEDAVAALIKMHNYQLSEQNHLRVSFSKSNI